MERGREGGHEAIHGGGCGGEGGEFGHGLSPAAAAFVLLKGIHLLHLILPVDPFLVEVHVTNPAFCLLVSSIPSTTLLSTCLMHASLSAEAKHLKRITVEEVKG